MHPESVLYLKCFWLPLNGSTDGSSFTRCAFYSLPVWASAGDLENVIEVLGIDFIVIVYK